MFMFPVTRVQSLKFTFNTESSFPPSCDIVSLSASADCVDVCSPADVIMFDVDFVEAYSWCSIMCGNEYQICRMPNIDTEIYLFIYIFNLCVSNGARKIELKEKFLFFSLETFWTINILPVIDGFLNSLNLEKLRLILTRLMSQ